MYRITFFILSIAMFSCKAFSQNETSTEQISYEGFRALTMEVEEYRKQRLVDMETFNAFSKDYKTLILDTRSKRAFDAVHIEGAVHLNFSDFTEEKLASIIPDRDTRILIYCNNNFRGNEPALMMKSAPLALNIPTFINLYGYGYTNIYELNALLDVDDERVDLVRGDNDN